MSMKQMIMRAKKHASRAAKHVISHVRKHKRNYLFGIFGSFAVIKMTFLFAGFFGILSMDQHHASAANRSCGDGTCSSAITCNVSKTDCGSVNTGICIDIDGCSYIETATYSSYTGIPEGCDTPVTIVADNAGFAGNITFTPTGNGTINDYLSVWNYIHPENTFTLVSGDGDQWLITQFIETSGGADQGCVGKIKQPKNESDCTRLSGLLIPFGGITVTRKPQEDANSCPVDCANSSVCGNGITEGSEMCDDGKNNGLVGNCNTKCDGYYIPPTPVCGNGIIEGSEMCDDGSGNSYYNGCSPNCTSITPLCSGSKVSFCAQLDLTDPKNECGNYYDRGYQCQYDKNENVDCTIMGLCSENTCGDGKVAVTEICDDGQYNGEESMCNTTCTGTTVTGTKCGNSIVEADEACDDGNNNSDTTPGACNKKCSDYTSDSSATLSTGICDKVTEIPKNECIQLVTMYNSTDGNNWTNNTNRGDTESICRNGGSEKGFEYSGVVYSGNDNGWHGIYCIDNNVAGIIFKNNNLVGNFDLDFYQFPSLFALILEGNPDIETISDTISGAQSLTVLNLNDGIGSFPGGIVYLQNLEHIFFDNLGADEMWYLTGLFPKLKGLSFNNNYVTTIDERIMTLRPDLEYLDFSNNCIDTSKLSSQLLTFLDTKHDETNPERKDQQDHCKTVIQNCGNGKKEGSESCDDGENNGKVGMCNSKCTGMTSEKICGNSVIEAGETCDDGIHNGKPGQCTTSCDTRKSYNGFCGDTTCRSTCSLDEKLTCNDLTTLSGGMDMCATLGCYVQNVQEYSCKGRVSCSEITPEKFWGTVYGAQKYCNIAGCAWDDKTSLCGTPKTGKNPSCTPLNQEYCGREPGCTLTNQIAKNVCMGNTPLRTDKLNQAGCATINGQWNIEDTNSCNSDCQAVCAAASIQAPSSCSEISIENCTNYYVSGSMINCIVVNDKTKGIICTNDNNKCTSCGNNICDGKETEKTCAKDCVTRTPTISYTPKRPKDGSLISSPVTAKLPLPAGKDCKILNNNNGPFYTFKYNGYYVYQIVCPWFEKPWDVVAKVDWIQSDTIMAINAKDISQFSSGGSLLYCENTLVDNLSSNTNIIDFIKTNIYTQGVISGTKTSISQPQYTQEVKTDKNISFEGDSKVYQKLLFEKEIDANATKQVSLSIPSEVNLNVKDNGETSDFNGVFLAPTQVTGSLLATVAKDIENIDVIIKAGDSNNQELSAKDQTGDTIPFTMTIWTRDALGSLLDVYSSQEGNTWAFYTGVLVEPCTDKTHLNGYNCATFEVPHLTYYGITTNLTGDEDDTGGTDEQPSGGSNGGGGGSSINQCTADRDCKNSYLNQLCGACTEYEKSETIKAKEVTITCDKYTTELNGAYAFAFANAITTISNCEKANLQGTLLRSHMAKMMSNFAINTLGIKPNTGAVCAFTDMDSESSEMRFYATLACQLGLMGLNTDGTVNSTFSPNELVTRAQFGTVLSRLLRGDKNNGGTVYYEQHLQALKNANIMKKISAPGQQELRGRVMLMLQRITDQVAPSVNSNQTLRESIQQLFGIK